MVEQYQNGVICA